MADQSMLQTFIQNAAGTHTAGQTNVPGSAQSGNPNGVYNWTSYLPTVTPGQGGASPTVSFDLIKSQPEASSPGYTPPFTADPYAAMALRTLPSASENSTVNTILANLASRGASGSGGGSGGSTPPSGCRSGNCSPWARCSRSTSTTPAGTPRSRRTSWAWCSPSST